MKSNNDADYKHLDSIIIPFCNSIITCSSNYMAKIPQNNLHYL